MVNPIHEWGRVRRVNGNEVNGTHPRILCSIWGLCERQIGLFPHVVEVHSSVGEHFQECRRTFQSWHLQLHYSSVKCWEVIKADTVENLWPARADSVETDGKMVYFVFPEWLGIWKPPIRPAHFVAIDLANFISSQEKSHFLCRCFETKCSTYERNVIGTKN